MPEGQLRGIQTGVWVVLLGSFLAWTATARGQEGANEAATSPPAAATPAAAPAPAAPAPAATAESAAQPPGAATPADAQAAVPVSEETKPATVESKPEASEKEATHAGAAQGTPAKPKDEHSTTEAAASHAATTAETHGDTGHAADDHAAHGGGHGHHDPYDLSHQNATKAISQVDELKADLALWSFVVFLLLLAVLSKFAWGPIMQGLHTREESIAAMIDDAKASSEKAAELLRQYEAKLAAATDEINELRVQARKDAEATKDRILVEARDAAQRERERAIADIGIAKTAALQEITGKSVDLAVILASRLIQRQLTADDRVGLVREALDQMPSRN